MKKLFLIPFLALVMVACGPSKKDVIAFNDEMVREVAKCSKAEKAFFETCATYNPVAISKSLKEFTGACKSAKTELEATKPHEELVKLKEAALHLATTYVNTEKEYIEYARLFSIQTENYTKEDEAQTSLTAGKINDAINAEFDAFKATQKEFSEKYKYSLESNK